jgi:nucleotide-binding universal stress UspA family protein
MKVLLAVDGSDGALRAAKFVARLFAGREAHVDVVNVQAPVPYGEILAAEVRERLEQWKEEQGHLAAAGAMQALESARVPCRLRVVSGDPAPALAALAREIGAELIVMGTRGLGSLAGLALGSVAAKVVHLADAPVTLVK